MRYSKHFEHRRLLDLDGARGILALCIVLFHAGLNKFLSQISHGLIPPSIFPLCVDAFFILSGFVLTASNDKTARTFYEFARARFFRLAPIFYITTLAALLAPFAQYDWRYWFLEAAAGKPLIGDDPVNWLGWSVTFEFYIPIAAMFAARYVPALSRREARLLLPATIGVLGVLDVDVAQGGLLFFPRAFFGLAAGHLLCRSHIQHRFAWRAWMTPVILALSLCLMVIAGFAPITAAMFPITACCLVVSGSANNSLMLSSRPAQWLGGISYTLYMAHAPILQLGSAIFGHAYTQSAVFRGIAVLFSIVIAAFLTRFVEIPLIDYAKHQRVKEVPRPVSIT